MSVSDGAGDLVKILFPLERDEDGYPPHDVESMWAKPIAKGLYEIDNIPFFANSVACGDVVRAREEKGHRYFSGVVKESGHSTVRIMMEDPAEMQRVRDDLASLGCETERGDDRLIAVDIPPSVTWDTVLKYLVTGAEAGRWDYEEACIARRTAGPPAGRSPAS